MLEEGKPAVKVPRSKLDPHLAKYRSETDRLRSEYDKNAKELADRSGKLEAVLKAVKADTAGALRELGVDPDAFAEQLLSARVKQALREEEEKADPSKKAAREAQEEVERLRKEKEEREAKDKETQRAQLKSRLSAARDAVIAKLPEAYREGAAPLVLAMFRQAMADKRDVGLDDVAKAVLEVQRGRVRSAYEKDESLRTLLGGVVTAKEKPAAEVVQHPASKPAVRTPDGKFQKKPPEGPTAGDVLLDITRGKFG